MKNKDRGCLKTGGCGEYLDVWCGKWLEFREDCIMKSFITCTVPTSIIRVIYQGKCEMNTESWSRNMKEGMNPLGKPLCR
jgi:hypothetical protein